MDRERIADYVQQIAALKKEGYKPVIVSSGAVAAGYARIGYRKRPQLLPQKQAAAAVGQALLMQVYQELFAQHGVVVAQLLLTRTDFTDRVRCRNAFNTLEELLNQGVVPIINENDSVSVDELKFGDNDALSSFVANLVKADKLIIITDTNGLYTSDPRKDPTAKKLDRVEMITDDIIQLAGGAGSAVGLGGMRTKIEAARVALFGGISVYIGQLSPTSTLFDILAERGDGTYFPNSGSPLSVKKQWLSFHSLVKGEVYVDEGAEKAIVEQGKSLLPAGVIAVHGEFHQGDVVEVKNRQGESLGRGICNYNHWQLKAVLGLTSEEVEKRIQVDKIEVIHRDEWVSNFVYRGIANE